MNNYHGHDVPKLVSDPDFESGALFDVEAPVGAEPERHLRIAPTLGAVATEKHTYPDVRSAAAGDDTFEDRKPPGEPIIPQSPRRVVNGITFVSVPGPVPVIPARRRSPEQE